MGKINCDDDMLFEKTVSKETIYEGRVFDVEIKEILTPEGKRMLKNFIEL